MRDLYKPTRAVVPLGLNAMGDGKGWAAPPGEHPDEGHTQEEWDAWDAEQAAEQAEQKRFNAIGKGKGKGGKAKAGRRAKAKARAKMESE